eukprot:gnl/MRDRNA2_/MRDRNA2_89521_c0_seq1.p1 gnl/MRDRNA2_/MRDRNA2_89521_c0~~gnl/MRDRNA2_/MRDRNA2_89521_c0_seq1.p1  ORF type:complete len:660 (-),score=85.08 gnl/MRDRNA2_/MRDRNA2_89521_c0_seq1:294-2273(-)
MAASVNQAYPEADENGRPSSRHGRPPSLPPSGRDGSLPPALTGRPGTPHASREPTPPPGKRSGSRPTVGGVLRSLSPANFLPKLGLGTPKKPEDPMPNTPRRPSPRRFIRGAGKEGGGACVTPRIKGAESPSGPPVQPLKEVNRDMNTPTPRAPARDAPKDNTPVAVRAPSPRQPAPTANAGHREMLEVQVVAKQLLAEVYRTDVTEETVFTTLQQYPEIAWLAHCASRCPQPPCWGRYDAEEGTGGQPCFINSQTGEASPHPPLLRHFAHLAALALQARQEGKNVKADLHRALEQVRADSELAKTAWDGPHLDNQSGAHYWFSADLGCSTWGDPAAAADFLARVISELLSLIPTPKEPKEPKEPKPPKKEREPTPQEKEEQEKEDNLVTIAQEIRELQHPKKEESPELELEIKRPEGPLRDPTPPPRVVHRRAGSLPRSGTVTPDSSAPSPRVPVTARPQSPRVPCRRPSSAEPFFGQSAKAPEMKIFEDAPCRPGSPSRSSRPSSRPRTARVLKLPDGPAGDEDVVRRPRQPSTPCARGRNRIRLPACFEDSEAEKENVASVNEASCKEAQSRHEVLSPRHKETTVMLVNDENAPPTSPSIFDVPRSPTLMDISRRSRDCNTPPSPSIIIVDERRARSPPRERPGSRRGRGRSRDRH